MTRALTVDDLLARAAISDVVHRYATGIDRRDWALFRSIFTDEVTLDFSSWNGAPPSRSSADDWTMGVKNSLSGFDATQHVSSNHVITLGGDTATCVSYMMALHYLLEDGQHQMQAIGGYYTNRLVRGPDGWKIHACTLTATWEKGDRGLFQIAQARWGARSASRPSDT
jgi:hypothetical protein